MKKIILYLSLTCGVFNTSKAQLDWVDPIREVHINPIPFIFELVAKNGGVYISDSLVGSNWVQQDKNHFVKDGNGNVTDFSNYSWDGTKWVANFGLLQTLTYNSSNKVTRTEMNINTGGNSIVRISNYSYDESGRNLPIRGTETIGTMTLDFVDSLVYNSNNKIVERFFTRIFMGSSMPSSYIFYTHNSSGQLIEEVRHEYASSKWEQSERINATYNANGKIESVTRDRFEMNNWVPEEIDSFYYDNNGNLISEVSYYHNGTNYTPNNKNINTYNLGNNITETISFEHNGTNWVNDSKVVFVYENNKLTEGRLFRWLGNDWETTHKERFRFSSLAASVKKLPSSNSVSVYPNPANNVLNIESPFLYNANFQIFDINGASVLKGIANEGKLNIAGMNNGIYFIVFEINGKTYKSRFVKE